VWGDGRLPQPVHPAIQAVWRNYFLKNLVQGCPPRLQRLWDWLYLHGKDYSMASGSPLLKQNTFENPSFKFIISKTNQFPLTMIMVN
jgi:hypothetical protein